MWWYGYKDSDIPKWILKDYHHKCDTNGILSSIPPVSLTDIRLIRLRTILNKIRINGGNNYFS